MFQRGQRAVTIAPIAATVEIIHVGKEIIEKFHDCTSVVGIAETFLHMSSLEQAGTLSCALIVAGAILSLSSSAYRRLIGRKTGNYAE